jgi:hypothetical protein
MKAAPSAVLALVLVLVLAGLAFAQGQVQSIPVKTLTERAFTLTVPDVPTDHVLVIAGTPGAIELPGTSGFPVTGASSVTVCWAVGVGVTSKTLLGPVCELKVPVSALQYFCAPGSGC